MQYIDLDLSPLLLFAESKENSFYEDVTPAERVEASGVLLANFDSDGEHTTPDEQW